MRSHISNAKTAIETAWQMGFHWVDFVSSFNNPLLVKLEKQGWVSDEESESRGY